MLTRRTALVATLAAAVTATTTKAHAATYTDIQPGTPFYAEITWAANKNLISGYPDGTFKPDEPIDRQSFARAAYTYRGKPAYTPPIKSYFFVEKENMSKTTIAISSAILIIGISTSLYLANQEGGDLAIAVRGVVGAVFVSVLIAYVRSKGENK